MSDIKYSVVGEQFVNTIRTWFTDYAASFAHRDTELDRMVDLKLNHSLRVAREMLSLAKQLGLAPREQRLAYVIGLLHDVGRFEQYAAYRTFADEDSLDHAALGVEILKRAGCLNDLSASLQDLIEIAIGCHNQPVVPASVEGHDRFFARLVRDADKLDILRVVTDKAAKRTRSEKRVLGEELPASEVVGEAIYRRLRQRRVADFRDVRNHSDLLLLRAGWVFDINFLPALRVLRERGYLEILHSELPATEEIEGVFQLIERYLDERLNSGAAVDLAAAISGAG